MTLKNNLASIIWLVITQVSILAQKISQKWSHRVKCCQALLIVFSSSVKILGLHLSGNINDKNNFTLERWEERRIGVNGVEETCLWKKFYFIFTEWTDSFRPSLSRLRHNTHQEQQCPNLLPILSQIVLCKLYNRLIQKFLDFNNVSYTKYTWDRIMKLHR